MSEEGGSLKFIELRDRERRDVMKLSLPSYRLRASNKRRGAKVLCSNEFINEGS